MATNTEDFEWIFDYIVTFLKSPPWTVPLNTFIDENCVIFDSDEENKLSYTDVHTNFVKLVEDLLESNLAEIGVSQEQFVRACEKGQNQEVNKLIFGQILAVEDFLTFKKMMIKRNMELEVEALRALQQPQVAAITKPNAPSQRHSASPTNQIEADAQLELAIRLSQESSLLGQKTNSETTDSQSSRVPDSELEAALRASVVDQEVFQSEYQKEQAELEHALAISLALEAEKIRHEQAQAEAELKAAMEQVSRLEASEREEKRKALEAAAKEREAKESAAREAAQKAARELAAKHSAEREAREKKQREEEAKRTQQQQQSQQAPPKPKPSELPSITISGSTAAHEELRLAASRIEDAFSRNHEAARQQKQQAREALQTQGAVSNGELERRKEFLLQQKQLILARKKKERDEQLRQFNEEKKQITPPTTTAPAQQSPAPTRVELTPEQLREQQRLQMREALAKRLKVDMVESERKRMAQQAENKYAVLNEQLRQVEALREKKTKQSAEEEAALVQQEKERQAKLRAFHENLRKQGVQVDDFSF